MGILVASVAVGQASVPEVTRAGDAAEARRANRTATLLAMMGAGAGALLLLVFGTQILTLFSDDSAVRERALALLPLMLLSSLCDAAQAVKGMGLTALKRSSASLWYFAVGYGLLVLAAVPVARTWGITGLWVAMAAANGLLAVLQGLGFHRHSARVGQQLEPPQLRKV
ncbi:MATE family efflux transporter [Nonomuraea polychroma]|uniref:MATE family efflux transporter n=1 Tax=Nonomuraea polychroma TaxID=46176 RepID=UPI003D8AF161